MPADSVPARPPVPTDSTFIAHIWEHSQLCLALFGVQFQTDEGAQLYEAAGIPEEMMAALEAAHGEGLLLNRPVMTAEGPLLMQYWRSYGDLDRWARKQPHARWWRWLQENAGQGVSFYHEIYVAGTAEAIYERGSRPVGPALFCTTEAVKGGQGHSKERQRQFAVIARGAS